MKKKNYMQPCIMVTNFCIQGTLLSGSIPTPETNHISKPVDKDYSFDFFDFGKNDQEELYW